MNVIDCEQGSAVWLKARQGRITSSRIADCIATLKRGGESAARAKLRMELIAERMTGLGEDHYVTKEMQWGTEQEPIARAAYEVETDTEVRQVGFAVHPRLDYCGASPDGLIGPTGGIEIKCAKTTTHLSWMMAGGVPVEYQPQMLWVMACCGLGWLDFVSYDPRVPLKSQLYICRFERDDKRIEELEEAARILNEEVLAGMALVESRGHSRW